MKTNPGTLSVKLLSEHLGIGMNVAYRLVHQDDFPSLRIDEKRIIVPINALNKWLYENSQKPII